MYNKYQLFCKTLVEESMESCVCAAGRLQLLESGLFQPRWEKGEVDRPFYLTSLGETHLI